MKKFLLTAGILISIVGLWTADGRSQRAKMTAVINECRTFEGAEVVHIGSLASSLLKGIIRASDNDPDTRMALSLMNGVRGVTVFEYEDCSETDKSRIGRKVERALDGSEILLETVEDGEKTGIYGVMDEKNGNVRDIVLYTPSDCAVICIFGSVSMEALEKIVSSND